MNWDLHSFTHSMATFNSSSQVLNFSLGLFFRLPSLFSVESICSQALNGTTLTFRSSNARRRPSLPGFGELEKEGAEALLSRSSHMLATWWINDQEWLNIQNKKKMCVYKAFSAQTQWNYCIFHVEILMASWIKSLEL